MAYLFYILFFILPFVFFPKTSEVFEFNKMVTVYIFTVLITTSWIIKMVIQKRIVFKRTILDIPLLIFIVSQVISTLLSIDQRTSIFGYYSRFNGGLLSTICYALLYWAFVSNFSAKNCRKLIILMLISSSIVAVYGILEHFGASISCLVVSGKFNDDCWVQDVRNRVFATLGQPNWLAAYLTSLVPLTWYGAFKKTQNKKKIIYIGLSVIFFACILFTKSRSGLLGLAVAAFIFGLMNIDKYLKQLMAIAFLFLILIGIFGTPVTPSIKELINHQKQTQATDTSEGGTESGQIREIVWKGAIDIWKAYPVFGTGVETFGYSYWQFRPVAHNNTSEWDYLYNKAHNEYLNYLANTGTIGLLSYLFLVLTSIYILRKNSALLAGYISILITNFFGFSVVNISLISFMLPAIAVCLNVKTNEEKENKLENNQKIWVGVIIICTAFILFLIGRYWYADYLYSKARSESQTGLLSNSYKDLQNAISLSSTESIYHNEMARVLNSVTLGFIDKNEASNAAQIASYAIEESDNAFSLSPRNMNIRETRISVFLTAAQFDNSYLQKAIELINDTINISPTDPKLHLILGKVFANQNKIDLAIAEIKKALQLKSDYIDAKRALETLEENSKKF